MRSFTKFTAMASTASSVSGTGWSVESPNPYIMSPRSFANTPLKLVLGTSGELSSSRLAPLLAVGFEERAGADFFAIPCAFCESFLHLRGCHAVLDLLEQKQSSRSTPHRFLPLPAASAMRYRVIASRSRMERVYRLSADEVPVVIHTRIH